MGYHTAFPSFKKHNYCFCSDFESVQGQGGQTTQSSRSRCRRWESFAIKLRQTPELRSEIFQRSELLVRHRRRRQRRLCNPDALHVGLQSGLHTEGRVLKDKDFVGTQVGAELGSRKLENFRIWFGDRHLKKGRGFKSRWVIGFFFSFFRFLLFLYLIGTH